MRYIYFPLLVLLGLLLNAPTQAQDEPKTEMRATWVASVSNIDWPKYSHRGDAEAQKAELIRMLNLYKSLNMNAIFLQVRPECDALYNSAYEPWSRYLTWTQGDDPGYDPLAFAIEEAHKRGIELHAWCNPYRINAKTDDGGNYYHETHIYKEHPEWAIEYSNGKNILNPGLPEVMVYIGDVVEDLASNYNLDGIHFDDYFYSYDGTPSSLDQTEYELYNNGMSLSDWRRDNVNRMIDTVYQRIQKANPNIRFGVSPFGIYKPGVPDGISGMNAYSQIYCDPLAWLENNSVDYLTPQLYWPTGGGQDFEKLANWWSDQVFENNRHLYTGHGTYRLSANPAKKNGANPDKLHETKYYFNMPQYGLDNPSNLESMLANTRKSTAEWSLSEIGYQIDIVRLNHDKNGLGNVFFSAKDFDRVAGLAEYIVENKYTHPALVPEMTWKSSGTNEAPANLRHASTATDELLSWDHSGSTNTKYVIYVSYDLTDAAQIIAAPENIIDITFEKSISMFALNFSEGANFVVTAVSPVGQESSPSNVYTLDVDFPYAELLSPYNDETVGATNQLSWQSGIADALYKVQVSSSENFSTIHYESDWMTDTILPLENLALKGETTYYWRVRVDSDIIGPYSHEQWFTTGFPKTPVLLEPQNLNQSVHSQPYLSWASSAIADSVRVIVSASNTFDVLAADEYFPSIDGEALLTTQLKKDTWYYIKIQASNNYGPSPLSEKVAIKTIAGEIPEILIVSPDSDTTLAENDMLIVAPSIASDDLSYFVEIALDEEFSSIIGSSAWTTTPEFRIGDFGLDGQRTYFWHAKLKNSYGESYFSKTNSFIAGYPSRPSIVAPVLTTNESITPTIKWLVDETADSVLVELTQEGNFSSIEFSQKFPATPDYAKITTPLDEEETYYLRIKALNDYGGGVYKATSFKTGSGSAIPESSHESSLSIHPNILGSGHATLLINNEKNALVTVSIRNILGQKVKTVLHQQPFMGGQFKTTINRSDFNKPGIYFIEVTINELTKVKRIVIK